MKTDSQDPNRISAVRRFNRFYTRQIGVLRKTYLGSPYSLAEMRVLYGTCPPVRAPPAISAARSISTRYLSRVLRNFEKAGLITRKPAPEDAAKPSRLHTRGAKTFAPYEQRSQDVVATMLGTLKPDDQARLIEAMTTIEHLLAQKPKRNRKKIQMSSCAAKHGDFAGSCRATRTLRAGIWLGRSVRRPVRANRRRLRQQYDTARERCWIAE